LLAEGGDAEIRRAVRRHTDPYRRRSGHSLMKRHRTAAALSLILSAACAASAAQDPERERKLGDARAALAAADYDAALALTDALLKADPSDRDARLIAADGNLGLVDSGRSGAQSFLQDAANNLRKALEVQAGDADTWLKLSQTLHKAGDFAGGRDAAQQAVALLEQRKAPASAVAAAYLTAADNELQLFVAQRRLDTGPRPSEDSLAAAQRVLARIAPARRGAPAAACRKAAIVLQWLGQDSQALAELERGILADPTSGDLHDAYLALHVSLEKRSECVASYKHLHQRLAHPVLLWHLGRARAALADEQRSQNRFAEAIAGYRAAEQDFANYAVLVPAHRASVAEWQAILELSMGRVAVESGDLELAKQHFVRSYERDPRVADYVEGQPVIHDAFGGNYLSGLFRIGQAIVDRSDAGALESSLQFYEWILGRHPDRFGAVYNNAGLSARDLGVAVAGSAAAGSIDAAEREARLQRAMQLWEKSYRYYCKAVELEPDDPRIVNDCGLMLVYHLRRDYDRARALFEKAIELGEAELAALPADAADTQRNFLEEAVGDAWQNIAVLLRQQDKPRDAWAPFCEKAVKYYPYQNRQAAAMLRGPVAQDRQDPKLDALFGKADQEAKAKAEAGDFDGALLVLDGVARQLKGYAPFHHRVGVYNLRYANHARDAGGPAAQVGGLYADAVKHLKLAVEADGGPLPPRLDLASAQAETGEFAAALATVESLLSHARSLGGAEAAILNGAHRVRAQAGTRVYIAARQADDAGPAGEAALRAARASYRELETGGALDDKSLRAWLLLEQWAGAADDALAIVLRALERAPDSQELLGLLVEHGVGARSAAAVRALQSRTDPTGLWYAGRVRWSLAQHEWSGNPQDPNAALATIERAIAAFEAAKSKEPGFATTSEQWIGLALGSKGLMLLGAGKLEEAETALLAAGKQSPSRLGEDLGGGQSIKRGLQVLIDKKYQAQNLAGAEQLLRQALALAPDDIDFLNNHGLFARDHGDELERQGKRDAAREMFESSYRSYARAAELEPDNIRLTNDKALLLLYHLHRNEAEARAWLETAIAAGEGRLQKDPPADSDARRDLQEAVGDCWQNLGYYKMTVAKDYVGARAAFEKSLTFHPHQERASRGHLEQLKRLEQGK
jgi:Flp pilus assembly protein TadD